MRVNLRATSETAKQMASPEAVVKQAAEAPASSNPFIQNTRAPGSVTSLTGPVTQQAPVQPPLSEQHAPVPHEPLAAPRPAGNKLVKDLLMILGYTLGFLALLFVIWFLVNQ